MVSIELNLLSNQEVKEKEEENLEQEKEGDKKKGTMLSTLESLTREGRSKRKIIWSRRRRKRVDISTPRTVPLSVVCCQ